MFEISKLFIKALKSLAKNYNTFLIAAFAVAVFLTLTPFLKNTFQTPNNRIYLGAENSYTTYFHYLAKTLDGQNLSMGDFKNRFNIVPIDEKYYLLKGRIDTVFAMSNFTSYHLSRLFYNVLFFFFLFLIISHIYKNRSSKLAVFSFISFLLLPIINSVLNFKLSIINFYSYPHIAFLRLILIFFIFLVLKLLRKLKILNVATPAAFPPVLILIFIVIGFFINQKQVNIMRIDLKKDSSILALIYPSKDYYEGIGYIRDNALPNEKVICLKRCSVISESFAGISPLESTPEEMSTITINMGTRKKFQQENAVYWFIGPEEKPLLDPEFPHLLPKEVFKNKEVTIYKLLLTTP